VRSGTAWTEQQELTASDGAAGGWFGLAVSLDGDTAAIGAGALPLAATTTPGAAYVFVRSGTAWSQQQELTASDGADGDEFGYSVSVSGGTVVIGAADKGNGQGAAYAFGMTEPTITGVGVSGGGADIAQNAWVSIYGTNLAPASVGANGLTWSTAPSFASGEMPTSLGGVSVTVNGLPAYIYFVGAAQVNVLTPLDSTIGPVAVVLNNGAAASAAYTANMEAVSPGFLRLSDGIHIVAEHVDGSLVGPSSMSSPGYTFTPAAPGESISLYGDGFGLPATPLTSGSEYQTGLLPVLPQVTIGGAPAIVAYAGVISPGLYQINLDVPATAANGDNQVIANYAGVDSPAGAMIPIAR
jgi:uncharacterized protein (TIGR03437 family)